MRILICLLIVLAVSFQQVKSQGCVAIRSNGAVCTKQDAGKDHLQGWQLNVGYRYFKSFRHFVGTKEQKQRIEEKTDVRNWASVVNFTLARHLNHRWSLALDLPVLANRRSSLYEHGGRQRHSTHSFGLGDIRVSAYRWLLDPAIHMKGNVQVGLGIKLPTGDYKYQDFFYKADSTQVLGPVDQSIQLGDGGTGFTTELNAYYNFSHVVSVYGNFFYLFNPREQNGVSTARGATPSATSLLYQTSTMSVPDQYMARAGANISIHDLTVSGGMRMECIPVHDLIGGSTGFRRPGYVVSAEPGVSYQLKKLTAFASVPVALVRSRTQSVPDKIRSELTDVRAQGDAAFADYSINIGMAIRF
ncbi:MAG: hypothetical protein WKF97_10810 [Chitinophagaceae bacterium]